MLASQRIESVVGSFWGDEPLEDYDDAQTKRGAGPSIIEWLILAFVSGEYSENH
jgi:transient receptor potential cation channel subfamily C member 4